MPILQPRPRENHEFGSAFMPPANLVYTALHLVSKTALARSLNPGSYALNDGPLHFRDDLLLESHLDEHADEHGEKGEL